MTNRRDFLKAAVALPLAGLVSKVHAPTKLVYVSTVLTVDANGERRYTTVYDSNRFTTPYSRDRHLPEFGSPYAFGVAVDEWATLRGFQFHRKDATTWTLTLVHSTTKLTPPRFNV